MARDNFLWGAPRIHGELLMLGFSVSQANHIALPACTKQKARAGVANFFSQSNHYLQPPPVLGGAFSHGVPEAVGLFLLGPAHAACGADCEVKRGPLSLV